MHRRLLVEFEYNIERKCRWENLRSSKLTETAFYSISCHSRVLESWNNQSNTHSFSRHLLNAQEGSYRPHLEMCGPDALPLSRDKRCSSAPRVIRASRGKPRDAFGVLCSRVLIWDTHRQLLSPFLGRRARVARPTFVSIRARKPCVLSRRVLRGR